MRELIVEFRLCVVMFLLDLSLSICPRERKERGILALFLHQYFEVQKRRMESA